MKRQKTFDESEPVIQRLNKEQVTNPNDVTPRSRSALEVYDEIQALELVEEDPLF